MYFFYLKMKCVCVSSLVVCLCFQRLVSYELPGFLRKNLIMGFKLKAGIDQFKHNIHERGLINSKCMYCIIVLIIINAVFGIYLYS